MNSINQSLINRQNRLRGAEFEKRINKSCEYYEARGEAAIKKTPEPMRVLKNLGKGQFLCIFLGKAQPDYKGSITGGRSIVFEAKFTSTDKMLQNKVNKRQAEEFERHYALGAICFVLVGFSSGDVYRIPWRIWRNMKDYYGHKYVNEEDIQYYKLFQQGEITLFLGDITGAKREK